MSDGNIENTKPIKRRSKTVKPAEVPAESTTAPLEPAAEASTVSAPSTSSEPVPEVSSQGDTINPPELSAGEAQPSEVPPPSKPKRGWWIALGIAIMLVITAIGSGIGYAYAIRARNIEIENQHLIAATTQYEMGLADQAAGRLSTAQQRFEYVLKIYPKFPGISDKLVEIGLAIAQSGGGGSFSTPQPGETPAAVITPVPTQDTRSVSILFKQAQDQLRARDWAGLYTTINSIRDINPEYNPIQVDGMYYMALRNRGISEIEEGHLEQGMYSFALAEKFAPIDYDAEGYRTWARMYIDAGSNWSVNWYAAVEGFAKLYTMVPMLRDASGITVTQRYARALIGYGDSLAATNDWCGAAVNYEQASGIYNELTLVDKIPQAQEYCKNPPPPTPTAEPGAATPTATP